MWQQLGQQTSHDSERAHEEICERGRKIREELGIDLNKIGDYSNLDSERKGRLENYIKLIDSIGSDLEVPELVELSVVNGEYCFFDGFADHGPVTSYSGSANNIADLVTKLKDELKPGNGETVKFVFYTIPHALPECRQLTEKECAELEKLFYQNE